ncbi:chromate resistance protein ChrB domain-containing protein [Terricaulis silvestris]|uniref:tRNA 2-selenouridine synthase n=1 Tax=Terricaulis silvestris TaxID=2686094 RepID=A0A6I6MRR9_9CAUL|nr:sulfurtransferase/chromate resistance protein [Terricaulis silvestris]QGZ94332.1 tRNA 2-selenouridine synthase [Terricaulis silvestris]
MPSTTSINVSQLTRLIGVPGAPLIVDVRKPPDAAADSRLLPASRQRDATAVAAWAHELRGKHVVVVCQRGGSRSQGAAAWLRAEGIEAEILDGGFEAWRDGGGLLVNPDSLPKRDAAGHTVWVTRARPKVDRIACPWLIRRFVDPDAVILFVAQSEVLEVAERYGGAAFDIDGVFWSHRGELCTFDVMLQEFGLKSPALDALALIVRGADTARLDLAPQSAGLLAASLGLSRMFRDDLAQLDAGMLIYDAFYRWQRDAVDESHDWPGPKKG